MAKRAPHAGPPDWAPSKLLEIITDGVSVQDRDLRILYTNSYIREMFGEDLIGKHCYATYERRAGPCDGCPVQASFSSGKSESALRVGVDKNGASWFADIIATPLRNDLGEIIACVEVVRNITDRKLIEEEIDKRNREQAALADVATALNRYVELDDILAVALDRSIDVFGAEGGMIRLIDEQARQLVVKAWRRLEGQPVLDDLLAPMEIDAGIAGKAVQEGKIVIINDLLTEDRLLNTLPGQALLKMGGRSVIMVPLATVDKLLGVMALASSEPNRFAGASRDMLAAITSQISMSIENAGLLRKTREDAALIRAYSEGLEHEVAVKTGELAREQEHFEHTLNSLPVGVHLYDERRIFIYANETFFKMVGGRGYTGMTIQEIYDGKPRRMTPRIRKNILRCLSGEAIAEDYLHPFRKIWMHVRYVPVIRGGQRYALITTEDITEKIRLQNELKRYAGALEKKVVTRTSQLASSEKRYRRRNAELTALNAVAVLVNQSLNIKKTLHRALNKIVKQMDVQGGLIAIYDGRELTVATYKNVSPATAKAVIAAAGRQEFGNVPVELRVAGQTAPFLAAPLTSKEKAMGLICLCGRAAPSLKTQDKNLLAALGSGIGMAIENARLFDEAEEKSRNLARAYAELKDLDRLKSEFVSVVSHELRTPMAAIKGYVEVVKDGLLGSVTPIQKAKLAKAERHVDDLTRLVADLLDLSAMETRKFKLAKRRVPISGVVSAAVANTGRLAAEKRQKISTNVRPKDLQLKCDALGLTRLLSNLLENAVKFSPVGGSIKLAASDRPDQVMFQITDQGSGIPKEHLPKIFDRFFVGHSQPDRATAGTGLGLAIVKGIVEAHGGNIWVESKVGRGTIFTFVIPKKS